jgi:tetratricopeptide (TPR) repeat protein
MTDEPRVPELLAKAGLLINMQRLDDAEAILRQALAVDSEHATAHALLSHVLTMRRRFQDAALEAQAAIALAPNDHHTHLCLALARFLDGRLDEAQVAIEEAMRLNPLEARYHAVVANIAIQREDWQEALAALERSLAVLPDEALLWTCHAAVLLQIGRSEQAQCSIDRAMALDPEMSSAHLTRGFLKLPDDHGEATASFREAVRLEPTAVGARQAYEVARDPLYQHVARYRRWLRRFRVRENWAFASRIPAVARALRRAEAQPAWHVLLLPFHLTYFALVLAAAALGVLIALLWNIYAWIAGVFSDRAGHRQAPKRGDRIPDGPDTKRQGDTT